MPRRNVIKILRSMLLLIPLALYGSHAWAAPQIDDSDQLFREVAGGLRCPSCQGLSVLESDASFAVQMREEVKRQLAAGKNQGEIYQFFTDRFGVWILREPPARGFWALLWALPVLLLVSGALWGFWLFWRDKPGQARQRHERSSQEILIEMHDRLAKMHATQTKGV